MFRLRQYVATMRCDIHGYLDLKVGGYINMVIYIADGGTPSEVVTLLSHLDASHSRN